MKLDLSIKKYEKYANTLNEQQLNEEYHILREFNNQIDYDYEIYKSIAYLNIIHPLKTKHVDDIQGKLEEVYNLGQSILQGIDGYKDFKADMSTMKKIRRDLFYCKHFYGEAKIRLEFLTLLGKRLINLAGNTMHYVYHKELKGYKDNKLDPRQVELFYGTPDNLEFVTKKLLYSLIANFEGYECEIENAINQMKY